MNMNLIRELIDNEEIARDFEKTETQEEMQLIALLLVRNNLQMIRKDVESIHNWMKFFGIMAILSIVLAIIF